MDGLGWIIDAVAREATLFAAVGFLIGGLDDLAVDLLYILRRVRRRGMVVLTAATLPPPAAPGHLAVFVPVWDEAAVIGQMLRAALSRFDHADYSIHVGLYPNDRATIEAAAAVAEGDDRVRLVVGSHDGPTTKADCLNTLWHALRRDDAAAGRSTKAVILHDAEDVVHPQELRVYDRLIEEHAVVQLPVLPLVKHGSRLVSGHYADEFAESHAKQLVVRTALGAGMPLAGVGCAIATETLSAIAAERGGDPFDAESLTEDYELGLRIAQGHGQKHGRGVFARVWADDGGLVAVRAYFPDRIDTAVRQKARWMTGIALAGWDRTGWARRTAIGDHWMRMRDRRAPIGVLLLATAYVALVAWGLAAAVHWWAGTSRSALSGGMTSLLLANTVLLGWRLAMRMAFTGRFYGWREALWSLPRFVVGNYVALLAARRAIVRYVAMLRGEPPRWDKTRHEFPDLAEAQTA